MNIPITKNIDTIIICPYCKTPIYVFYVDPKTTTKDCFCYNHPITVRLFVKSNEIIGVQFRLPRARGFIDYLNNNAHFHYFESSPPSPFPEFVNTITLDYIPDWTPDNFKIKSQLYMTFS